MKLGKPLQTLMVNEVKSRYSNKIGINYPQNYNEIDFWVGGGSKFIQKNYFIAISKIQLCWYTYMSISSQW